jgi:hypothetical protein
MAPSITASRRAARFSWAVEVVASVRLMLGSLRQGRQNESGGALLQPSASGLPAFAIRPPQRSRGPSLGGADQNL